LSRNANTVKSIPRWQQQFYKNGWNQFRSAAMNCDKSKLNRFITLFEKMWQITIKDIFCEFPAMQSKSKYTSCRVDQKLPLAINTTFSSNLRESSRPFHLVLLLFADLVLLMTLLQGLFAVGEVEDPWHGLLDQLIHMNLKRCMQIWKKLLIRGVKI